MTLALLKPLPVADDAVMVDDLVEVYLTMLHAAGRAPGTIRLRRRYLSTFAQELEDVPLRHISPELLAAWLATKAWAPETRRSAVTSLRVFWRWAMRAGYATSDPTADLPRVKLPVGLPRPAPDDVLHLALARADRRVRLMLLLAACAGLRRAEIATLRREHLAGGVLRVTGKGGRVRVIPLPAGELLEVLEQLPAGYVFPGRDRGHLSADRVGRLMRDALGPRWTAHTLRHRFASVAYAADRDMRAVQELLGHSSPVTTARYTAVPAGALLRAVEAAAVA